MDELEGNPKLNDTLMRKVRVPARLLAVLDLLAEDMDTTPKWCLGMLMQRVDHLVDTRPEVFGFEFERALKRKQERETQVIDVVRLHRSDRTKSGFVGVYANGKGFTAMAKASYSDPTMKSLGTFPTAVQAAEARRVHYLKLGIPYGALAERIETFRDSAEWSNASDELKRRQAIHELAKEGTPAEGISDEERVWETEDPLLADHEEKMAAQKAAASAMKAEQDAARAAQRAVRDAARAKPPS